MAGQRAGLVDGTRRSNQVHEIRSAAVRADRHTATDDLPQRRQVGPDTEPRLRPAALEPETGDDLVEHEQGAVSLGDLAQMREIARRRRDDPRVGDHRLHDDSRDLARPCRECLGDRAGVVVWQHDRGRGDRLGHAGAARDRQGRETGPCLDEQSVRMSVIGAGELDDEIPTGRRPRDANDAHHRLGARRGKAQALDRWHRSLDRLAELDLERVRCAEREPVPRGARDRVDDRRVRVTENRRTPRPDVVDVAPPVGIPDVRPRTTFEHERRPADCTKGPHRAVDPAGKERLGALDERRAPRGRRRSSHHGAPRRRRI